MHPILKWPGGKTGELKEILTRIPPFERYIEPFLGGGAVYFALEPDRALVNDVSPELMGFYGLLRENSPVLRERLSGYAEGFAALRALARGLWLDESLALLREAVAGKDVTAVDVMSIIERDTDNVRAAFGPVETDGLFEALAAAEADKLNRTARLHRKKPMSEADLARNAETGYLSGAYLHARAAYNRLRAAPGEDPARAAAFFFVREYCYGAMFRYNGAGEFNIPYGGASYNNKDFAAKVEAAFAPEVRNLLRRTALSRLDFGEFLKTANPGKGDFLFLDPPYDTAFSDYGGHAFTMEDQARLAELLRETPARFLLVIRDTPRIRALYGDFARIETRAHQYAYNVRGRNARGADHLYITNCE